MGSTRSGKLKFSNLIHDWFYVHERKLPWRETYDPYAIWVSEVMLQQTQADRVKDYYSRFLKRFPTVQDLADAKWEELMDYWRDPVPPGTPQVIAAQRRGLGYYRRARNLHKAAQTLVHDFDGKFPRNFEDLKKLPGIGPYTAAAIASFAYGEKVPALDTNLSRIFERVFSEEWKILKPLEKFYFAQKRFDSLTGREFNYGLMDLGATICTARQPKCDQCCFQKICDFNLSGQALAQSLEMKSPRKKVYRLSKMSQELVFAEGRKVPHGLKSRNAIKVAAGMLIHNGKVLIATRPKGKLLAGLWEFPGGKLEPGEDERTCLKREFMEELGVEVAVRPYFYKTFTDEDGLDILLTFHRCSLLLGEVKALEGQDFKWVDAEDLDKYEFPRANREVIEILKEKRGMFLH